MCNVLFKEAHRVIGGLIIGAAVLFGTPLALHADDFYKGKQITLVISAGPGGGYATYVLIATKYMSKHIPGHPEFIRQHRQGAGGIVAANYLAFAAKRDGTVIGGLHRGAVSTNAVFHAEGVKYDPRNFGFIGSVTKENNLCVSFHTSPIKSFKDVQAGKLVVAGMGPGADTDIFPMLYNNLFGAKFELITGYTQGNFITLALERGEVDGRCGWTYSSLTATKGDWLKEKKLNFLVLNGLTRDPGVPTDVPLAGDLARTPREREIIELAVAPQEMARPILSPPEIPKDRLQMLRDAFDLSMKDPEFLAEAKARQLDVAPLSGVEVQDLVARLMATPPDIVNATIEAISRTDRTKIHKIEGGPASESVPKND